MKKNKLRRVVAYSLTAVILLSGTGKATVYASDKVERTYEFTTTNKEETHTEQFTDTIREHGKNYRLNKITYKVVSEEPVMEEKEVTKTVDVTNSESAEPEITEDGITYSLDSQESGITDTATATGYTDYDHAVTASDIPQTKTLSYNGKTVTGKLVGIMPLSNEWVNSYINITFYSYDAEVFDWNGIEVRKGDSNPLAGYEKELLASVGESSSTCRLLGCSWSGEPYTNNDGTICRDAVATIQKQVTYYRANYSATVNEEVYRAVYKGTKKEESGKTNYKILATAVYEEESSNIPAGFYIAAGIGILLIAGLLVAVLFLLTKQKKEKEENNG